jgi:hypothetical protein
LGARTFWLGPGISGQTPRASSRVGGEAGERGLRPLPLLHTGRPASWRLVGFSFVAAATAWVAAAAALVAAAPDLAAGRTSAPAALLAAHLLGVVFLPLAVTGAAWHLLPVMLRNDLRRPRLAWAAALLLGTGGPLLAAGIALDRVALAASGGALLAAALGLALSQLAGLVLRAPRGKRLVVSRTAVALSALHAVAAGALGVVVFASGSLAGEAYERALLVHVSVAGLGWLTLLILAVGRTLAPMLALAPAPEPRRVPAAELTLAAGLWLLVGGIALGTRPLLLVGTAVVVAALAPTAAALVRAAVAGRIGPREGPLAHLLVGAAALTQAALLVPAAGLGLVPARPAAIACVLLLLLGWAGGVVIGHLGKLLSLSAWASWPPGPRPKQAALYPRRLWQAETVLFGVAVFALADGVLLGSAAVTRAGAGLLVLSSIAALAACLETVRRAHLRLSRNHIGADADGPAGTPAGG